MNLKQLEYFRMIAELEHFTKASEKLLISQSSLSHSIKELEAELGVELFMRQGRNVKLTKYGQMFLPFVEQAPKGDTWNYKLNPVYTVALLNYDMKDETAFDMNEISHKCGCLSD